MFDDSIDFGNDFDILPDLSNPEAVFSILAMDNDSNDDSSAYLIEDHDDMEVEGVFFGPHEFLPVIQFFCGLATY